MHPVFIKLASFYLRFGHPAGSVFFWAEQIEIPSLKLTAKAPENGWLEYFLVSFLGQKAYFQVLCVF